MILEGEVWSVMQSLKVDELIARKTSHDSFLRKIMPRSRAYRHEHFEYPLAPELKMVLDRGDYSQWRLFSGGLRINPRIFHYFNVNPYSFTMFDIGANIGGYSALFSREIDVENLHIHLFEPNPQIFATLRENIKRLQASNLSINPIINPFGLGAVSTTLPFRVNENHSGVSTFGKTKRPFTKTVDVKIITLDEYAAKSNLKAIDFIKIDVEAYEPGVLKGAERSISCFRPAIYFEYSKEWFENFSDEALTELFYFLKNLQYKFFREGRDGTFHPYILTPASLREYKHLNILGVAK
jgi:FkbM family methyltransferase